VAKMIVEVITAQKTLVNYKVFDSDTIVIGRGFDNDVIINDQFISVRHLQISSDGDILKVKDLSSKNGTYRSDAKQKIKECNVNSGTEFIIGRTRIRIYLNSHHLRPTQSLHRKNKIITLIKKPSTAWILILVMMGLSFIDAKLNLITKEPFVTFLLSPISDAIIVLIWAGFWAFIGRLIRHRTRFFVYISCCCIWILTYSLLTTVNNYIGFYTNSTLILAIIQYIINGGMLITVLHFSLTFATNMRIKAKLVFSIVFTLLLISSIIGIKASLSATVSEYYTLESPYNALLKPPIWGVKKGISIERFIDNSDRLFKFEVEESE